MSFPSSNVVFVCVCVCLLKNFVDLIHFCSNRGLLYNDMKQNGLAIEDFLTIIVKLNPRYIDAWNNVAFAYKLRVFVLFFVCSYLFFAGTDLRVLK